MIVGVLALQGNFAKHEEMVKSLGIRTKQVRTPQDLKECDALILPGGESTTLFKQIEFIQLRQPLIEFAQQKSLFGTCAGLIIMSHYIEESNRQPLNLLDVTIERNAFGRQADSFKEDILLQLDHPTPFNAYFIRAPKIKSVGPQIEVLATYQDQPVLVRQGRHLGACFHPELTNDPTIHNYFFKIANREKR